MILFVWNHFCGNLIFTWNFPDSASGFESCQHNSENFQDVRFVPRARKIILCLWLFNIFVCPGRAWKTAVIQPHLPFPRLPPARWTRFSQNQPQSSPIDWNCRCFTETFRTPCTRHSCSPRRELLLQPLPQRRRDSNPLLEGGVFLLLWRFKRRCLIYKFVCLQNIWQEGQGTEVSKWRLCDGTSISTTPLWRDRDGAGGTNGTYCPPSCCVNQEQIDLWFDLVSFSVGQHGWHRWSGGEGRLWPSEEEEARTAWGSHEGRHSVRSLERSHHRGLAWALGWHARLVSAIPQNLWTSQKQRQFICTANFFVLSRPW